MAAKDPFAANEKYGIRPSWMYRKSHPETKKILGLGPTATEEAIDDGLLDRPVPLTSRGKAMRRRSIAGGESTKPQRGKPNTIGPLFSQSADL